MRASRLCLITAMLGICSNAAWAECTYPKAPGSVPSGSSATESEMISTMAAFKQYNAEVDAYLVCLDGEVDSKAKEATGAATLLQFKAMQQKKRSSAMDEREAKVNQFNEQVRAFKSRKG